MAITKEAVDGLVCFPEPINAVFPKTAVQMCIVHMVRNRFQGDGQHTSAFSSMCRPVTPHRSSVSPLNR